MTRLKFLPLLLLFASCEGQTQEQKQQPPAADTGIAKKETPQLPEAISSYIAQNPDDGKPSQSAGTVSNGKLINGKLMPYRGENFSYFDQESYLNSRAFVNGKVKLAVLETYSALQKEFPGRKFVIMECSNKHGGPIFPHRTHQNGLSIDFMVPLLKDGKPYYGLDSLGASHYGLDFDAEGKYTEDKSISIDFELAARHMLLLEKELRRQGLKIGKVILKLELKDELFATASGKELKKLGIYFAQNLDVLINSLHDDHYHIDFEKVK